MSCKHNWNFVDGLTKRIRCTRCAALQFVDRDQCTDIVSDGALDPRNVFDAASQPEQEPVVWMYQDKSTHQVSFQKHRKAFVDHSKTSEVPLYGKPLANHELQCVCGAVWCGDEMVHLPNKTLPQRPWVGLTDEEIDKTEWGPSYENPMTLAEGLQLFARAIEAKLKEKNT